MTIPFNLRSLLGVSALLAGSLCLASCSGEQPPSETVSGPSPGLKKVGVLLVSHGSHSGNWRKMLVEVENRTKDPVLADKSVAGIKSAFMEYNEPSIATRLKEFDREGFSDVVLVPILLTVSTHSFDDIPVIVGLREDVATLEELKMEKIEVYRPKAAVTITPLMDYDGILRQNVVRRIKALSKEPEKEGVVLVAYGDETYNTEWERMIGRLETEISFRTGIGECRGAWCGHIVRYSSEPTEKAILEVLGKRPKALVVPLLVACDENFQGRIIGGAVEKVGLPDRILYKPDSILPDESVNRWVVKVSLEHAAKIHGSFTTK